MNNSEELQVFRQWMILRTLASRRFGVSVRELAEERRVVQKTIRRDIDILLQLGFALVASNEARGRKTWKLSQSEGCPALRFTHDEAVALSMARGLLEPFRGTELQQAADRGLGKIQATLSEQAQKHFEKLNGVFHFTRARFHTAESKAAIIDELTLAIEECRVVDLMYQSQKEHSPSNREVHPYSLITHNGSLYLRGFSPANKRPCHYKIARIDAVKLKSLAFPRPPESEVARRLTGSFGIYDGDEDVTVTVKILPPAARYVRELDWLPAKELVDQNDGSLLARFELTSTVEIKSWVLSFGASAVILEPESLRISVAEELKQLLGNYRTNQDERPRRESGPPRGHEQRPRPNSRTTE